MGDVVGDVQVLAQDVRREVPHPERGARLIALHLLLEQLKRMLDGEVRERLRDALVLAHRRRDV